MPRSLDGPDDRADPPADFIFRAAIPGMSAIGHRRPEEADIELFAPGRPRLEASVVLSAFAILVPASTVASLACALLARSAGNRRWLAATVAAVWCGLLGALLRAFLGIPLIP